MIWNPLLPSYFLFSPCPSFPLTHRIRPHHRILSLYPSAPGFFSFFHSESRSPNDESLKTKRNPAASCLTPVRLRAASAPRIDRNYRHRRKCLIIIRDKRVYSKYVSRACRIYCFIFYLFLVAEARHTAAALGGRGE